MKWIRRLACMALILMAAAMTTMAAPDPPEAVSYFAQGQTVYAFCDMKGRESRGMTVKQFDSSAEKQAVKQLGDLSGTVHYVLVVDNSTSMYKHWRKVRQFIEALIKENESADLKVTYTLAIIGEAYKPLLERADDGDAVLAEMKESLSYKAPKSNLYKGITSALDYLNRIDRQEGELTDLVVISDGVLYDASESPTPEEVAALLKGKKENLVQTIGMDEEIALGSMNYCGKREGMADAAADITGYINSLSRVRFFQKTGATSLDFYFQEEGKQADHSMTIRLTEIPVLGKLANTVHAAGEAETAEPESSLEETEGNGSEPEASLEEAEGSESEPGTSLEETEGGDPEPGNNIEKTEKTEFLLIGMILCGVLLAAGILAASLRKAGKKMSHAEYQGIPVELEVLSGKCVTRKRRFYLEQQLVIGSSADCDIVFNSRAVSEKNTRVFLKDGKIYIEDLKSDRGTALGGMRIYAPNILRSGEVISIERVAFRLIY